LTSWRRAHLNYTHGVTSKDLVLTSDGVKYVRVAVGKDDHRNNVAYEQPDD